MDPKTPGGQRATGRNESGRNSDDDSDVTVGIGFCGEDSDNHDVKMDSEAEMEHDSERSCSERRRVLFLLVCLNHH